MTLSDAQRKEREKLENELIDLYSQGKRSHRQVGEALGLDYWQTEEFFKERKVPLPDGPNDLEEDRKTIELLKTKIPY